MKVALLEAKHLQTNEWEERLQRSWERAVNPGRSATIVRITAGRDTALSKMPE